MNEEQWLSNDDPEPMLYFLGRKPSRKLKLFAFWALRDWMELRGPRV